MAQARTPGNGTVTNGRELYTEVSPVHEGTPFRIRIKERLQDASGLIALGAFIVAVFVATTLFWANIRDSIHQAIVQSELRTAERIDNIEQNIQNFRTDLKQTDSQLISNLLLLNREMGRLENQEKDTP